MTDNLEQLLFELRSQHKLLEELLSTLHRARIAGADLAADSAGRKNFLALLSDSLDRIQHNRNAWFRLDPARKQDHPEIAELLRENQNLILKILVLDRDEGSAGRETPGCASPRENAAPAPDSSHLLKRLYGHKPSS